MRFPLILHMLALTCVPLAAHAGLPSFSDVTASAGVSYTQHTLNTQPDCFLAVLDPLHPTNAPGVECMPERMSGGAAVGDVDGDGWPDLFVTRLDDHDLLFRNLGQGSFADVSLAWGLQGITSASNGAAFGDLDNDGDLDLVVTTLGAAAYQVFINDRSTFTEEGSARGVSLPDLDQRIGYSVAVGDYDGDGYLDLMLSEWRPGSLEGPTTPVFARLMKNRGAVEPGHFDDVSVAAGVVVENFPASIPSTGPFVFAPGFVDLDDDGHLDIAIAGDYTTSRLFWNQGDGTFLDGTVAAGVGTDENGMGSTFGDYDLDGDLDWFVTSIFCQAVNWCSGNRLYRNDGGRSFTDVTDSAGVRDGDWGWGAAFFDPDNDGDLDLIMTNGVEFTGATCCAGYDADPMRLWENDGTGVMTEGAAAAGIADTGSGKGLLIFDFDRDGDEDVFVVNNGSGGRLFRNDFAGTNHWLRVKLNARESAVDVPNARVLVTAGGVTQIREIGTTSHFLGQSERVAHFGLGSATAASVRVEWPNGKVTLSPNPQIDQLIVLNEPLAATPPACGLGPELVLVLGPLVLLRRRKR